MFAVGILPRDTASRLQMWMHGNCSFINADLCSRKRSQTVQKAFTSEHFLPVFHLEIALKWNEKLVVMKNSAVFCGLVNSDDNLTVNTFAGLINVAGNIPRVRLSVIENEISRLNCKSKKVPTITFCADGGHG